MWSLLSSRAVNCAHVSRYFVVGARMSILVTSVCGRMEEHFMSTHSVGYLRSGLKLKFCKDGTSLEMNSQ